MKLTFKRVVLLCLQLVFVLFCATSCCKYNKPIYQLDSDFSLPDNFLGDSNYKYRKFESYNILPSYQDVKVKYSGNIYWLEVTSYPDLLFSKLVDFWTDEGFDLEFIDPRSGIIETDWKNAFYEKYKSSININIKNFLGLVISGDEKERFRMRVERLEDNVFEIYITGTKLFLQRCADDGSQIKWIRSSDDMFYNRSMLYKLMVFLGTEQKTAKKIISNAEEEKIYPVIEKVFFEDKLVSLKMYESFENVWRRVGLALDKIGVSINKYDRENGIYEFSNSNKQNYLDNNINSVTLSSPSSIDNDKLYKIYIKTDSLLEDCSINYVSILGDKGNEYDAYFLELIYKNLFL